jgi:hypothetical protein
MFFNFIFFLILNKLYSFKISKFENFILNLLLSFTRLKILNGIKISLKKFNIFIIKIYK